MKRLFIYIFILVLFSDCAQARKYENLEVLCKVWGFVKYHHPVFADSTVDADAELFKLLPLVTDAGEQERNRALSDWITELGEFQENKARYDSIENNPDCKLLTDLNWIDDSRRLGGKLSEKLKSLRYADRKDNRYLQYRDERLDNPDEVKYDVQFPDNRLRLLALFRYWNLVEYFFPYKDLTDKKWENVIMEYLPKFINAKSVQDYRHAVYELFTETCDSHAFSDKSFLFGTRSIPVQARIIEDRLIVTSTDTYASLGSSGLLSGDEIVKINGKRPDAIHKKVKKYISSSTEAHRLNSLSFCALLSEDKTVNVRFRRDGTIRDTLCSTVSVFDIYPLRFEREKYYRNLGDSIAYLYLGSYKNDPGIRDSLDKTKGVIIDLRTYPTHEEHPLFWNYFLRKKTHITTITFPMKSLPGYFEAREEYWSEDNGTKRYSGKIVVLVNEETQSAAEYDAMILQSIPGTVVIGSGTSGADGNVIPVYLSGNISSYITGLGIYYPDGTPTQRIGVKINEVVKPTIQGIRDGRDEVLERAVEIINHGK